MSTRNIRTPAADLHVACDVCGRTLLRGERSHPYLEGSERRTVCELCTSRAQHEGWLREGTVPDYEGRDASSHRRRPLLGRLRFRRPASAEAVVAAPEEPPVRPERPAPARLRPPASEPRHVRAIPASLEQRMAAAVQAFNSSEHPRTMSGIARSLGLPVVSIRPVDTSPGTVRILLAWELCWYRYEVDLRDDPGGVRLNAQGSELHELAPAELEANATTDESGVLSLV
ncbi:MAG TPA: hypothetical protein VE983_01020 [Solirubrobacteraceae bacterium]|nr:hypothetical protein [Solirubrobacteraceae bacterium]